MIFLDTSGIFALADVDDRRHAEALCAFTAAQDAGERFLVHSYVLVESAALLQRRLSLDAALKFLDDARAFDVRWVDDDVHSEGVAHLSRSGLSDLSLVDAISFVVMQEQRVSRYLGFDRHFADAGFVQLQAPR